MAFDEELFRKKLAYRTRAGVASILADVARIRAFDREAEARLRKLKLIGGIGIFVMIGLGLFVGSQVAGPRDQAVGAILGAFGGGIIAMVVFFILLGRWSRLDLEDARYEWIERVLPRLATDMAPDAQFEVEVNMEPLTASSKVKRKSSRGRYSVTHSVDPWLKLGGRFLDGTRFQLTLDEEVESRVHAKGHKRKLKRRTTLRLVMRPKEKRYGNLNTLREGVAKVVQLPRGLDLKAFDLSQDKVYLCAVKKHKSFNEDPPYKLDLDKAISLMFLSVYQVLNLSRRVTRSAG